MREIYNGYIIEVKDCTYKIIEEISPNKFKNRRTSNTSGRHTGHDQYGRKLYKTIKSDGEAMQKAKDYIDNYIVKWADSPNDPLGIKKPQLKLS